MTKSANYSVLVVDDTETNIDILLGVLGDDYEVSVATDGETALELVAESPPDLILLDVMMPGIDGYEVCRRLKQDIKTREIPVIFITAMSEVSDETKGFDVGAVDYITKPISPPVVKARVKNHLSLRAAHQKLESLSGKLGKYLSPQVYQSIFEGTKDARLGTSRKKLTVFFSDIVGFTARTDSMESEDLNYILNGYLNYMSNIVFKYGGTLDKFIGDAILVFFGDPESKGIKEDAEACVAMALEMRDGLAELHQEWINHGIEAPFQVRMGISTGYCTVGNFGSDARMDYTIIGNQVNLASRLETSAEPNQILVSNDTWSLIKSSIHCSRMNPIRVKGFEHPIQVYEVIDFQEHLKQNRRVMDSRQGFSLLLDADLIANDEKAAIMKKLSKAISFMND
jgi:adenylate cyclase